MWMILQIFVGLVINKEHSDAALDEFMKLLLSIIDKHAPVKKLLELLSLHQLMRN